MKSIQYSVYVIFLLATTSEVLAQTNSSTKPELQYPIQLNSHDLPGLPNYSISARVTGHQVFEYTIQKDNDANVKKTFIVRPNNFDSFRDRVVNAVDSVLLSEEIDSTRSKLKAAFKGREADLKPIFLFFQGAEIIAGSLDLRPKAGQIYFGSTVHPRAYNYTNRGIKQNLRDAKRDAKKKAAGSVATMPSNVKELYEIRDKLKQLKARADSSQIVLGKVYINKQLTKVTTELDDKVKEINDSNYVEKMKEFRLEWDGKLAKLVDEVEYLLLLDPNQITVTYDSGRYTVSLGTERTETGNKRKAKKTIKEYHQLLDQRREKKAYKITHVELEFDEGYLENIEVIAMRGDHNIKFENDHPIGFSSKRDFFNLQRVRLFGTSQSQFFSISLLDVIDRYEQKHEVGRRDYSPGNQVLTYDFTSDPRRNFELTKELTAKLFELKTFSDFVGFDQDKPNGLIQFEVDKRLNIRSNRLRIPKSNRSTWGYFQFVTPSIVISKIEQNNKFLILNYKDQFTNSVYNPIKFTSTLELKRYENFSVGADVNIFLLDFPSTKSIVYGNAGFRYGRVSVRDSLRAFTENEVNTTGFINEYGVNTYTVTPVKLIWEVRTDERYTFNLGWSINFYYLRDNSFTQVANIETFQETTDDGDMKYLYKNVFMQVALKPQSSGSGRLFFRYQYNWQQGFWRTGFHQIQVGYAVPLTKQLKTNPN